MIYLDNAATTYPKPESVYTSMDYVNRNLAFNAGRGSYQKAKEATKLIDETKQLILTLVNALPGANVAFTSSITIALNEIIQGANVQEGDNIYLTPYEHNAVARVCNLVAQKKKANLIELPLKSDTLEIDLERTKLLFAKNKPSIVCCNHVSNVTGYILPIDDIFESAKKHNAVTILDTAQSLGLVNLNVQKTKVDFVAFAGHKTLYGPLGIGGIISTSSKSKLDVVIAGGTGSDSLNLDMPSNAPDRYEYSSSNILAIAGLNSAIKDINIEKSFEIEKELLNYLITKLKDIKGVLLYCPPEDKHIGPLSFNVEGYMAEDVGTILDEDFDIAVRTGYHCAPYIHKYLKDEGSNGTVRIGVGKYNTHDDIDKLIFAITELLGD